MTEPSNEAMAPSSNEPEWVETWPPQSAPPTPEETPLEPPAASTEPSTEPKPAEASPTPAGFWPHHMPPRQS